MVSTHDLIVRTVAVGLWCRSRDKDSDVRRLVKCGAERCRPFRTLDSVHLLLRCLEQRCAAALPQASETEKAGKEVDVEELGKKTSRACAAACDGTVGSKFLQCLSQSCGINEGLATSSYCPSICHVISPDDIEGCLQRYCPISVDQEDQGGE